VDFCVVLTAERHEVIDGVVSTGASAGEVVGVGGTWPAANGAGLLPDGFQ
jgi:DNA-directed RNA polymerase subunit E'/Rpb7